MKSPGLKPRTAGLIFYFTLCMYVLFLILVSNWTTNSFPPGVQFISNLALFLLLAITIFLFLSMLFGRVASIGGPEHRDPTDQELKDAKERYGSKYLGRPNDSLPPIHGYRSDEE